MQLHALLTSVLHAAEWSASGYGRFTPGERAPALLWIGGWVGTRADLDAVAKRKSLCPCREPNSGRPVRSPVTILTELPRLPQHEGL